MTAVFFPNASELVRLPALKALASVCECLDELRICWAAEDLRMWPPAEWREVEAAPPLAPPTLDLTDTDILLAILRK
jgi:hypothetical protein